MALLVADVRVVNACSNLSVKTTSRLHSKHVSTSLTTSSSSSSSSSFGSCGRLHGSRTSVKRLGKLLLVRAKAEDEAGNSSEQPVKLLDETPFVSLQNGERTGFKFSTKAAAAVLATAITLAPFTPAMLLPAAAAAAVPSAEAAAPSALSSAPRVTGSPAAWFNEIHYSNVGPDKGEFLEVVVTSAAAPSSLSVHLYNGANGKTYGKMELDKFTGAGLAASASAAAAAPATDAPTSGATSTKATLSTVTPAAVTPSTVIPSTVPPATVTPSTVTPSTVTPSIVTPSTVTPSTVTPSAVTPATAKPAPVAPIPVAPASAAPTGATAATPTVPQAAATSPPTAASAAPTATSAPTSAAQPAATVTATPAITAGTLPPAGFTVYTNVYAQGGLQNGPSDGMALVQQLPNGTVKVLQFVSYDGELVAVDGPVKGLRSTDIGVRERDDAPVAGSLGLVGVGNKYEDFKWAKFAKNASPGRVNVSQTLAKY